MNFTIENNELIRFDDFEYNDEIIIPDGIKIIKRQSFFNKNISAVIIPDSVEIIESRAFSCCRNLKKVTFGKNISEIRDHAFEETPWLHEMQNTNPLVIVNNILINGEKADGAISVPEGVSDISDSAFEKCKTITSVLIPDTVKSLGKSAFSKCVNLSSVKLSKNISKINTETFLECEILKNIDIPEGITEIQSYAFSGCTALSEIKFPNSLNTIGKDAFFGTEWLHNETEKNTFAIANGIVTGIDYADNYQGEYTLPESVKVIGEGAFERNIDLLAVNLPESLERIEENAFSECHGLIKISIPKNVKYIGRTAFRNCFKLTDVSIPDDINIIEEGTFYNCTGLKHVKLGTGVNVIGEDAFCGCSSLETAEGAERVSVIKNGAFGGCTKLKNISISGDNADIEEFAFYNCISLNNIPDTEKIPSIPVCTGSLTVGSSDFSETDIKQRIRIAGETTDPKVLHSLISITDLTENFDLLSEIINNRVCELSTALTVFNIAGGYEYLYDKEEPAEDESEEKWLKFIENLYTKITEGKYKEGEIYFAPELKSSQLLMLRRIASEKESVFLYSHGSKK